MKQNVATLAVILVAVIFFAVVASHLPLTTNRIAGVAIILPALICFVLARVQLGSAFSVKARASSLVTTGLYARIRNPIYVFGALMLAGIIVYSGEFWLLLLLLVLVPLQVYRSLKEAQVLTDKFGTAYLEYRKKTWF